MAHVLGFHIVCPTTDRSRPDGAVADLIAKAIGQPADVTSDVQPGWTKIIVRISRDQFTTHGAPAIEKLFESACDAADAHFARTLGADDWALVDDGELGGSVDALDWLQYFGPRFGGKWMERQHWLAGRKSTLVTARATARGAEIVTLDMDPAAASWAKRQDAARELRIDLRPLPPAAQVETSPDARLQKVLPPEPVKWDPRQRRAMFDARVATMKAVEAGMADAHLFSVFRQAYLPGKLDEALLDRIATWLPHYGADRTTAAFRSIARLHDSRSGAAPLDTIALEGCVKLVSWGGDELPLATREMLTEHIVSLTEPGNAQFARQAPEPAVIQGMLKLTSTLLETCPCARCQARRAVSDS